jgi:hypothetical protein
MRSFPAILAIVLSIGLIPISSRAQWQLNGTPLSAAASNQEYPTIVSDGAGGAIVTWQDNRSGNYDIYVQRVNAFGVPQWTANGVILCTDGFPAQVFPTIVSDGAGGAIVTWSDNRPITDSDIYAQRVSASGVTQWTANGVALCTATFTNQLSPMIVSDGAGGAIVSWIDLRNGNNDIFAQRVNASGVTQWTFNGVALCTAANSQDFQGIVSDGAAGAIVTWQDLRGGATYDIYAQRVSAAGIPQWAANGIALCTAANSQMDPTIVTDGAGGAVVAWNDSRAPSYDVYAQRVSAAGVPQWTANGVGLSTNASGQNNPTIASDGAGGAIVTWHDYRTGVESDIYAQRVSASGVPQWTLEGVALCTATGYQFNAKIVADDTGGAIVEWHDERSGNSDIYAQRVNASGLPQWVTNGVAVHTATHDLQIFPTIVADGVGGAIVTWNDLRSATTDVYAQRVEADFGTWGHPEPSLTSVSDVPSDQGGRVAVDWKRSGHDILPLQEISHYSVWRAVKPVAVSSAAASDGATWIDPSSVGRDFQGPAFAHERIGTTDYYWEWVANQYATHDAGYSYAAATREDSIAGDPAVHHFRVLAHTSNPYVLYKSNTASGYSVDNLAPAAPFLLTAQRVGANVNLRWNRAVAPDLRDYSIYRATSTGVTPVPINFLASSDDTVAVDASAPTSALYYIVTAFDVHANQSDPSNEASVGALTDVGNTPPITALTVLDNMPNPFTATTTLRVGLPNASDVEIAVFDVAGRRVREHRTPTLAAGWREIAFDARDANGVRLPSGVYFYRVTADGSAVTNKMVIAR